MAETPVGTKAQRTAGQRPTGSVGLRNFDQGVLDTLGAVVIEQNYWIPTSAVVPVVPTPGQPGIPVVFAFPEDLFERYKQPVITVRRDDISPALQRWHPGLQQYRAPAQTATAFEVSRGDPLNPIVVRGYDKYESREQAVPFDITYTISVLARHRGYGPSGDTPSGTASPKTQANALFDYVIRIFAPYTSILLRDSLGDCRSYSAFMEGTAHLDELAQVTERVIGFALTLRVEAELDLAATVEQTSVFGGGALPQQVQVSQLKPRKR